MHHIPQLLFLLVLVASNSHAENRTSLIERYSPASSNQLNSTEFAALWANLLRLDNSSFLDDQHKCAGPIELLQSSQTVDQNRLKDLCPSMLAQLDSKDCQEGLDDIRQAANHKGRSETDQADPGSRKPTSTETWGYGVLFVTLISLCSLVGVSVLPLMGKAFYAKLLTVLIGLAVGSLSGSSVFHLIPQAFDLAANDPHHGYLRTSILLFAGIWLFFMIERFLKIIMDWKDSRKEGSGAVRVKSSGHSHQPMMPLDEPGSSPATNPAVERIYESQEQVIKASFGHQAKPQRSHSHEHMIHYKSGDSPIATLAWMIIFGDGFHNFIDGLSLGAAFNESIPTGISISLAVMCEELPHELGDFAVLLSAGMSMRQALIYNFLSACTCYLGLAVGIVLGEFEASQYIFALAGGMFLYISLVDMMPEMNEVAEEASRESVPAALKVLALQNLGLLTGVGALYFLAKYQDDIRFV